MGLFGLTATMVIGGMAWATSSTLKLAQRNAEEQHRSLVQGALRSLDSYVGGVLNREAERPYTDYNDYYTTSVVVTSGDRWERVDNFARIASPILKYGPKYDWIDVYFQWDNGVLSSPQLHDVGEDWPGYQSEDRDVMAESRARRAWKWLEQSIPPGYMEGYPAATLASALIAPNGDRRVGARVLPLVHQAHSKNVQKNKQTTNWVSKRAKRLHDTQRSHLPKPECADAHIASRNIRSLDIENIETPDNASPADVPDIEITTHTFMKPFWLNTSDSIGPKLAFVRACNADAEVFHQGFVADWRSLKRILLAVIECDVPLAGPIDLVAVPNDLPVDAQLSDMQMSQLPVMLSVPYSEASALSTAWKSARGVLIAGWITAFSVLFVAGWGVRNLVAQTERRMQFAYAVTHELRTPLTTFRLYSDMLSAGLVPEESKAAYLDTLNKEAIRLSDLVEGVLEYARLDSQRVKLNLVKSDSAGLLDAIKETLMSRCQESGIEPCIVNDVSNGRTIQTDKDIVNRIASVLINNSCRHAASSSKPTIMVHLTESAGGFNLDVVDTGPGIELRDVRSVFKPFRRGSDADRSARGGIGLGLALARNWALLLGGRLDLVAANHPDLGGAHFRLTIPDSPKA